MNGCGVEGGTDGMGGYVVVKHLEKTNMCKADCRCLTGPEICRLIRVHSSVDSGAADSDCHSMCSPFMHYQVSAA